MANVDYKLCIPFACANQPAGQMTCTNPKCSEIKANLDAGMCKCCSLSGNKWYASKSCGVKSCSNRDAKGFEYEPLIIRCNHGMAGNIPGKYHRKKYLHY
jgi:hypothetical protein